LNCDESEAMKQAAPLLRAEAAAFKLSWAQAMNLNDTRE
jgi:hypothetical protein